MVAQAKLDDAWTSRSGCSDRIAALADLGAIALAAEDFESLTAAASATVVATLNADLGSVLERAPSGDRFLRRSAIGYRTQPPHAMSPEIAGLAAYTVETNTSIVVADLATETRFQCPALELEEMISGVSVVIRAPGDGQPTYGALFAGSRAPRFYEPADVEFVEAVAAILGAAVARRRTEEALRRSEERFDLLCESMRESALLLLGPEGSIASWNRPAEILFGWKAEDVIGKHFSGLCAEAEVCRGLIHEVLQRASSADGQADIETFALRRDGTHFRAQFVVSSMRRGTERKMALYVRNITPRFEAENERARLAVERERLLDEARRAVAARDDTIAVVSHDLRNPVGIISLAAGQLSGRADTLDPAAVRMLARRIDRAAKGAEKIIGDLLDVARIELGQLVVEPRDEMLCEVLAEAVDAFAEVARQRDIAIRPLLEPIRALRVLCDRARIVQVLSNLVGNALKFMVAGRSIDVEGRRADGEIIVSVRDQGPGLTPEQLEHVFDRYWQGDPKEAKRGLGLGLAIVKGIITAHGGRVWAESVAGEGATFSFSLPFEFRTAISDGDDERRRAR